MSVTVSLPIDYEIRTAAAITVLLPVDYETQGAPQPVMLSIDYQVREKTQGQVRVFRRQRNIAI